MSFDDRQCAPLAFTSAAAGVSLAGEGAVCAKAPDDSSAVARIVAIVVVPIVVLSGKVGVTRSQHEIGLLVPPAGISGPMRLGPKPNAGWVGTASTSWSSYPRARPAPEPATNFAIGTTPATYRKLRPDVVPG